MSTDGSKNYLLFRKRHDDPAIVGYGKPVYILRQFEWDSNRKYVTYPVREAPY